MRTVLFVCVGNASRSQMAEAFFNHLADGKARAMSAGTKPASTVDPKTIEVMREAGIDISAATPKALTMEMLERADRVVTMGCGVEGISPPASWRPKTGRLKTPRASRSRIPANQG